MPRGEVSRHHAMLECAGAQVQLVDMGGVNGTYVNGKRITRPVTLSSGDTFAVHDSLFVVLERTTSATETPCPHCGERVRPGKKFCSQCGTPVA